MEPEDPLIEINSKLFVHQKPHLVALGKCYDANPVIFDASDTGTGKTATMCALAKWKGILMFIISPKPVVESWFKFAEMFGVVIIGVSNYEAMRMGKYYTCIADFNKGKRIECPYIKPRVVGRKVEFDVNFPDRVLVVFDEAHKGNNYTTQTSQLLVSTKEQFSRSNNKIAILSATIIQSIDDFRITAYVLGISQFGKHAYNAWLKQLPLKYPGATQAEAVNKVLFAKYSSRMRIHTIQQREAPLGAQSHCFHLYKCLIRTAQDLDAAGDLHAVGVSDIFRYIMQHYDSSLTFKSSDIRAEVYNVSPEAEKAITDAYDDISQAIEALKAKQQGEQHPLTILLRARQRIEMVKVPTIIEAAMEFLINGRSVVIFVNFSETIEKLKIPLMDFVREEFNAPISFIRGTQSTAERKAHIEMFQTGISPLIIVNIQAGGTGISLHHTYYSALPRATIISPPWSAITLKQALGRVNRAGSISDSVQRIVYCRGAISAVMTGNGANNATFSDDADKDKKIGVEEFMAIRINKKLKTIEWINNGDEETLDRL